MNNWYIYNICVVIVGMVLVAVGMDSAYGCYYERSRRSCGGVVGGGS